MRTAVTLLILLPLVLGGCGVVSSDPLRQSPAGKGYTPTAVVSTPETPDASFELEIGKGIVSVRAEDVPLQIILADLAERLSFELRYHASNSRRVSLQLSEQSLSRFFESAIQSISYEATYASEASEQGFRVTTLTVGTMPTAASFSASSAAANTDQAASGELAPEDVFIGSEPFELDLAERLLNPDAEQRAIAIRDLRATPNEFAIAEKMFRRDPDPAVAIAVLQLAESEDVFGANKMIVDALNHPDPGPVLYALDIINRRLDYSLMSRIEALHSHPSTSVQERAFEVLQSLSDTYPAPI